MGVIKYYFLTVIFLLSSAACWAGDIASGWKAYNSSDYATASSEWQAPADAGDADACFGIGLLYQNGFGVDMNDDLALKYYGLAAAAGHAKAQYNLGVMHENGWGVPMDEDESIKWYKLAADQGVVAAQSALGRFYAMDFSEKYDPVAAYMWFSVAEKFGDIDARSKRDVVASRMTPQQLTEADAQVTAWANGHENLHAVN